MYNPFYSMLLFGISGGEIFIILLLILVLFGPKKIPEIARAMGKGMNEIKKVQRDINAEINRYSEEIENPARKVKEDLEGFKKGMEKAMDTESEVRAEKIMDQENIDMDDDLPEPYQQKADEEAEPGPEPDETHHPDRGN